MTKVTIENAEIHTFYRFIQNGKGAEWLAFFFPYEAFPMYFRGNSHTDVMEKAEEFRWEEVQKIKAKEARMSNGRALLKSKRKGAA